MIIAISSGTHQGASALIVNAEGANNTKIKKNHFVFCLRVNDI
jgi:hypothetical protein